MGIVMDTRTVGASARSSGGSGPFEREPVEFCQPFGRSLRRRVLVVDDEALIRWSLSEAVSDLGCAVEQAATAAAALECVSRADRPFDVVLLDFRLPDSNTLELLARLRQLMPSARIILITAFSTPDVVQAALDLGAFRVMAKPFEIGEITQLVEQER